MVHPPGASIPADEKSHLILLNFLGAEAIVQVTNLLTQLIQRPGWHEDRQAGFSGSVMTGHLSKISPASLIASGFARVWDGQIRETTPMLGRHGRVSLY